MSDVRATPCACAHWFPTRAPVAKIDDQEPPKGGSGGTATTFGALYLDSCFISVIAK